MKRIAAVGREGVASPRKQCVTIKTHDFNSFLLSMEKPEWEVRERDIARGGDKIRTRKEKKTK